MLDMSTTVVTRGKLEVYERLGKELPGRLGRGQDRAHTARDARSMLDDMQGRAGGGMLPLGGLGTGSSGHKGYGLAVMVDILCAVLCGAPFGLDVYDTPTSSARVSHFFGAIRIDCFRDPVEFRRDMDRMLASLRASPPAEGEERVYYAGLPEAEREEQSAVRGVPLLPKTLAALAAIGKECGIPAPGGIPGSLTGARFPPHYTAMDLHALSLWIEKMLRDVPLLDAHTHLDASHLAARGLHDILLYHMVVSDLATAGCPDRDRLPEHPTDGEARARIERALPYLPGDRQHELLVGPAHHPGGPVRLAPARHRGELEQAGRADPGAREGSCLAARDRAQGRHRQEQHGAVAQGRRGLG